MGWERERASGREDGRERGKEENREIRRGRRKKYEKRDREGTQRQIGRKEFIERGRV